MRPESSVRCQSASRRYGVVGEAEPEEESKPLTAFDGSGPAHADLCRLCADSVPAPAATAAGLGVEQPAHEVQRSHGRAAPDGLAVAGEAQLGRASVPPGPAGVRRGRGRPASPPSRRPALRRPVTATATSAPRRSRAPSAIAAAVSAETAPWRSSSPRRHAEQRLLRRVRVGDDAADEHVARAGHGGEPRSDEAARARLGRGERQPARPARVRGRAPRSAARRGRRRRARARRPCASAIASARASAPGSTTRSTCTSKSRAQIVASTPSPSPPACSSARATADSFDAEEAQRTASGRSGTA